jgi:CRP-like cAMP-binding protein
MSSVKAARRENCGNWQSRFEKRIATARGDAFTDTTGSPVKNALLLAIPDREFVLLRPHLEYLELPHHQILQEPGQKIEFAYFLNHGMISLVILTSDGRSVEIAIVGHEGMVGTPLAVGPNRGPYRAIIQISASGFRVKSELLEEVLTRAPELRLILNRYVLIQGLQVAQIAACNRLHEVEQRLARWLLVCQVRIGSEDFRLRTNFSPKCWAPDGRASVLQREPCSVPA